MQSFSQYLTCRSMLAKKQGKGFSETETKEILRQVLAQLNTLHERRQSHGSISLDTIAYDQKRLMIVLLPSNGRNNPIYLAPEVVQTRQATPTADIYAVAVVMIVLLTGSPPEELKTATDMWNWEERCNISDRFIQILNIALSATRDFRYVNAGQMIRSLKPIIAIPEPKIDPTRINPAIASAKATQLQNEGSQDVSQDDLSMPTVAEASQHLNPDLNPDSSDPIDVNRFNSIPAKKSPFVAFTHGSNSIGSTKLDATKGNINGEDAVKSQFNRLEITGKSQGDITQSDFCAFQLPFSNEDADDLSVGAVPKNNKASITKTSGAGGIASSPNGSLISLKDNEESVESMPTSKFRLLLAAIFAGGIIIGGLLSVLILYRFIELSNNRNLQAISSADLDKAIARVYDSKKAEENIDKLLTLAKYKYEYSGNLSEAETMLQSIPSDILSRNKGDQLLVAWKEDQKKNSSVIQQAETALKNGNWQLAIDTVKAISPTPYWQDRGKIIAEEAKQRLAGTSPKINSTANTVNNNATTSTEDTLTNPASVAAIQTPRDSSPRDIPASTDDSQTYIPPSSDRSSRDSIGESSRESANANPSLPIRSEAAPPVSPEAPIFSPPPASAAPPAPRVAN
jgi:hypothetical protein